jgi:hypothetical protein
MNARLEAFLARIYVDAQARENFLANPRAAAAAAGLDRDETEAVAHIDRAGLRMAAESLRRKRERKRRQ